MLIDKKYELVNQEKFERALNGIQRADGTTYGGVGNGAYYNTTEERWERNGEILNEEETKELEFKLIAEYDRIGGFIRKNGDKILLGSFYDFKARMPRKEPKIVFVYKVNGRFVEVPDGVEIPGEVKAVKILEAQEAEKSEAKQKKVKKGKKVDEEE